MSVGLFVSVTRSNSLRIVALKNIGQNLLIEGIFKKMPKLFFLFLKRSPQQSNGKYQFFLNAIQYILVTYPVNAVNQIVFVSRWLYLLQSFSAIFLARAYALSSCTMKESASTCSPLSRKSRRTSFDGTYSENS